MNQFDAAMLSNAGRDLGRVFGDAITRRQANEDAIAERLLRQQMQQQQLDVTVNEAEKTRNQQAGQFEQTLGMQVLDNSDRQAANADAAAHNAGMLDIARQNANSTEKWREAQDLHNAKMESLATQSATDQHAINMFRWTAYGIQSGAIKAKAGTEIMRKYADGMKGKINDGLWGYISSVEFSDPPEKNAPNSAIMLTVEGIAKLQEQYAAAIGSGDMEKAKQIKERIAMAERMASPGSVSVSVEKDPTPADLRKLQREYDAAAGKAAGQRAFPYNARSIYSVGGLNPLVDSNDDYQAQLDEAALTAKEKLDAAMRQLGKPVLAPGPKSAPPQRPNAAPVIRYIDDGKGGYKKAN